MKPALRDFHDLCRTGAGDAVHESMLRGDAT
jgi:hypothetical protein